nr:crs5 [Clonostachys rosea]
MEIAVSDTHHEDFSLWGQNLAEAEGLKTSADFDAKLTYPFDMGHPPSSKQASTPTGLEAGHDTHEPIAICGMGMRLPGNVRTSEQLWELLVNKVDTRGEVPSDRYNAEAFQGKSKKYGYFLEDVDLSKVDTSSFKMSRAEIEKLDPQHRVMLEVTRETLENAGEAGWRGKQIGCYIGTWGDDWKELQTRDKLEAGLASVQSHSDFMMANKISFEYDFRGPSLVVKTACSSALVALHIACTDIRNGSTTSAIVGGANMLLTPTGTLAMEQAGVLSPNQSCRTFDADADGYCRAEAFNMLYIKKLDAAVRDGNPIRAIIRSTSSNHDGVGDGSMFAPSPYGQEAAIRECYRTAGIEDFGRTAHFECHGTGTAVGDPVETEAIANIWGSNGGITIGSAKPNFGHSEGASGITSVMKSILALEHKTVLPNIKFNKPNPKIQWESGLRVPTDPTAWPKDRSERISINAFGLGGSNSHVIIDSADSFGLGSSVSNGVALPPIEDSRPKLLVASANRASSAKEGAQNHTQYLAAHPEKLNHIAHTLALHREHLPWRTFAITNGAESPEFSAPAKAPSATPRLNFVFSGQGAQWAGMGAKLIADFPAVRDDFEKMEQALSNLDAEVKPSWKLREELLKSKGDSLVSKAEYAQPLSTALQIVIVNLLRSWGILPASVVGHSSGEIAAAYACGALTMQQAIICAYMRGYATTHVTRVGGMAAVGLGKEDAQPYLVDGVIVACENSPTTVTLSGDSDKLDEVIQALKKDSPDMLARRLHVDKAYHSHHMTEVSALYERLTPAFQSEAPTVPFFSSVTNTVIREAKVLGASYWRQNLVSPVLFNTAVQNLLQWQEKSTDGLFLEIGPHSALQGPIRQIQNFLSTKSAYLPTMVRNENDSASLLRTAGNLFAQGVSVAFEAVNPAGRVVPDLPRYSWHHDTSFWYESRLTKDWRFRKWAHHELLGSSIVESSALEPMWRNLLKVGDIPWLRDHMVAKDIILPGAAYMIMACEAMRQFSNESTKGFSLRNVSLTTALILQESTPTETIFALRPVKLTKSLDSVWHEFTVSSYNGTIWTQHCAGQVRVGSDSPPEPRKISDLPRKADIKGWYTTAQSLGIYFGPRFQGLDPKRTTAHPLRNVLVGHISNNIPDIIQEEEPAYPHALFIDYCLQLLLQAPSRGINRKLRSLALPTFIGSFYIRKPPADGEVAVEVSANISRRGDIQGNCYSAANDGGVVVQLENVKLTASAEREEAKLSDSVRIQWKSDLDNQQLSKLLVCERNSVEVRKATIVLQKLLLLSCVEGQARLDGLETTATDHLEKFRQWLSKEVNNARAEGYLMVDDTPQMLALSPSERYETIVCLEKELQQTQLAPLATAIKRILDSIKPIYTGVIPGLDVLRQDDLLTQIYNTTHDWDLSKFVRLLSHRTPNLRILEIGAGTGATTALILPNLISEYGERMFGSYVFTDISAGFFGAAKERFGNLQGMQFQTLDIGRDPEEQGFELGSFDLIVAANVLHATPSLQVTLSNTRKLLRNNGKLLLQEMHSATKPSNYVMGVLSGWWLGEADGRADEPYISPERWDKELTNTGFDGVEAVVLDDEEPYSTNAFIIASPKIDKTPASKVNILCSKPEGPVAESISTALKSHGLAVEFVSLTDRALEGGIISILDLEGDAIFENITEEVYNNLRGFLSTLKSKALWLTKPCQINAIEPQYAAIIGLTRTLRKEVGVSIGTLELDEIESAGAKKAMFDIYQRLHYDPVSAEVDPDYEFAWSNGDIQLPRCHWFSVTDEASFKKQTGDLTVKTLQVEKPGSLKTLKWSEASYPEIGAGNVLVDVRAVGMNFKDVLIAMGVVDGVLGHECAGIVTAVGSGVSGLQAGDRVAAVVHEGFTTTALVRVEHVVKIPDELSFEDAATMPTVYTTVIHSLVNLAHLEAGQTVLIHSACGGVGLSAIQISRLIGAEIFATVGSEEKVQYLVDTFGIPRNRIFNSRDSSFKQGVLKETGGKGVDVVLNSLSGELLHASWQCVAEFGTMVELGKRDFIGQGRLAMDTFEDNRAFFGVDMSKFYQKRPVQTKKLLEQMIKFYHEGQAQPIKPIRAFDAVDIQEAFRFMQNAQYIGKLVIRIPEEASLLGAAPLQRSFSLRSDRSYFLAGGLGGLGRSVSLWMAEHGAKNLVYLSRSGGSKPEDAALVRDLEASGCTAQIFTGSVANITDVKNAIDNAKLPVGGVLQFSMVLRDNAFENIPYEDWQQVWGPKVQGTWNLHNALEGQDLDFFLMFSSATGLGGMPGQSNYAAANTVLDAFVQARQSKGLAASVIDLGPVDYVGFMVQNPEVAARMSAEAFYFIPEQAFLDAIKLSMENSSAQVRLTDPLSASGFVSSSQIGVGLRSTLPLSSPNNRVYWRADSRFALYRNIEESGDASDTIAGGDQDDGGFGLFLKTADAEPRSLAREDKIAELAQHIGSMLCDLMLKPLEDLDVNLGVAALGVDSLVAIELKNWLRRKLVLEVSVIEIMNAPSLLALARLVGEGWMIKKRVGAREGDKFVFTS